MLTMKNLWSNYVLSNLKFLHLENKSQLLKVPCLLVPSSNVFFISLHIKLSSLLYGTQLVDMFAYEVGTSVSSTSQPTQSGTNLSLSSSVVVYNFHSVLNHERLFFFFVNSTSYVSGLNSISDLFQASNWLEREVDELHGISFFWKKDTRNLMLQYGDSSHPFRKSEPTVGFSELVFDPVKGTLINSPVSVQL